MKVFKEIAVLGAGNIGQCIAEGIRAAQLCENIIVTNSNPEVAKQLRDQGFTVLSNIEAVQNSKILIVAVQPKHLDGLMKEIVSELSSEHILISIVSGATCQRLQEISEGKTEKIVRVMANTAIQVQESMTLICSEDKEAKSIAETIFQTLGKTMIFPESLMTEATVLSGSAVALVFQFIRLLQRAGIQSGVSEEASLTIAIQVVKGAATLLQENGKHPEAEIDRVTTPGGCTIAALTELEAAGFGKALLKGVAKGIQKARSLY